MPTGGQTAEEKVGGWKWRSRLTHYEPEEPPASYVEQRTPETSVKTKRQRVCRPKGYGVRPTPYYEDHYVMFVYAFISILLRVGEQT